MEVESVEITSKENLNGIERVSHVNFIVKSLSSIPHFFLFFIFNWTEISKRRMLPFTIVKHFYVVKERYLCVFS